MRTDHGVARSVQAGDLQDAEKIKTVAGDDVTAHIMAGKVIGDSGSSLNLADVVEANVEASNGVAHMKAA